MRRCVSESSRLHSPLRLNGKMVIVFFKKNMVFFAKLVVFPRFLRGKTKDDQKKVLERAVKDASKETDAEERAKADKYVRIMRSVLEKGEDFGQEEKERVQRLLKGDQMSPDKRGEMAATLNVLKSFERLADPREGAEVDAKEEAEGKDEL